MNDFRLFERGSMSGDAQDAITNLYDYSVVSSEGKNIGSVKEVWLNDETGGEGFISVSTGWLFGRLCLIPAASLEVDDASRIVRVPYTEEKVKGSPDVAGDYHVTSEESMVVKQYYGIDTASKFTPERAMGTKIDTAAVTASTQMPKVTQPETDTTEIPLSEESVTVGKRQVQSGTVRLRKVVRTEVVNMPVELRREDVVVERVDPSDTTKAGTSDFTEDTIEIPLTREEAVVQKTTEVTGAVRVRKVADAEQQIVNETVRKEDVEVVRDQDDATTTEIIEDKTTGKNKRK